MAADLDAKIWAVIGASGTGKGLWIKQQLKALNPARLVIFDVMDEYADFAKPAATTEAVRKSMIAAGAGPLRVRYAPKGADTKQLRREFEALSSLVYAWRNCTYVAEELANVTTPSWAPAAWRKMTTSGRHQAVHIIGVTQSPAFVDKAFLGNATLIHCCALRQQPHRVAVATALDIEVGQVAGLQRFEWIERDFNTGALQLGRVAVPGGARSRSSPSSRGAAPSRQAAPRPVKLRPS